MTQNKRPVSSSKSTSGKSSSASSSKYSYERTNQSSKKSSSLLPIIGLILFVVLAVGGWLASDAIVSAFMGVIPGLNASDLPATTRKIIATVAVVIVGMAIFGLLAAIFSPKDTQSAKERDLGKEREMMRERAKAERAKQRSKGR